MKKFTLLILVMLVFATNTRADVEWTVWEGESTKTNVSLNPVSFTNIEAGDLICVYGTGTLSKGLHKQTGDGWTWGDISGYTATETGTDADYYYTVDADLVTLLGSNDLKSFIIGNWDSGTITKVSVKKKTSMIKTVLSEDSKTTSTFEYTIPSSSLANMVAGDYVYIAAERQSKEESESYKLEFKNASDWSYYTTIYNYNHDMWWSVPNNSVKDNNLYIYGEHYNTDGVYLYHPIPSFSIGSIGYATFSANQQVTAPASVTAYKGEISGDNLVLTPFTDNVIPANTGAIIKGDEGAVLEFTASSEETSETSGLIACTTATDVTTLPSGFDYYVLYPGTGERADELALSSLLSNFGGWNADITWDSGTYTLTYTKATGNGEGGWVGADWSAYDKLKLTFSANTLDQEATFYVAYSGHDDATTEGELAQGAKTVTINLNSDYKNSIGNFSIYSSATTGSLTFESAALIDNDGATVAEFRKTTSGTLAANKAYLKIANGSGARALKIVIGNDDITDISTVEEKKPVVNDGRIYNLNGQVVTNPSRGIYIKNGKKYVIE